MTGQPTDDQQTSRQKTARKRGGAYQGAFEAVMAIPIAAGIGLWADSHFDSSPWGLFIGTGLGFAAFVLRLVRLGREFRAVQDEKSDESPS